MTKVHADRNTWDSMRKPEEVVPGAVYLASSDSKEVSGRFISASDFL